MKKQLLIALLTLSMGLAAKAVSFGYASTTGSSITFDGSGGFSFAPAANDLQVGSGSAAGDLGEISGSFTIGPIIANMATVTGTGSFSINDGAGHILSATLTWLDIQQSGTGVTLNVNGSANLSGITYTGSNADLLALLNHGSGANTMTFQFIPAVTLNTLATVKTVSTFSGTVAVPDGGTTVTLLGCALVGLGALRRTIKFKAVKA